MSVNIKQLDGTLQKIAGNTIILDATASEIREGIITASQIGTVEGEDYKTLEIQLSPAMPDTKYFVVFNGSTNSNFSVVAQRPETGRFYCTFRNTISTSVTADMDCHWYAVRLVELEGYTALQNKVNSPDSAPTDNSTNLVTSGGVYDAIKNASSVFIGTSSEWESESTKTDYQVAILTDEPTVNAVDSTDGATTVVGEPNKRWVGTQVEWDNLTTAEKAKYEIVCFTDGGDASIATQFATISNEGATSTLGDYICSKNGKNVCVMLKGRTNDIVTNSTKLYSGFFNPLTPNNYSYLDIPFVIRNRTTNVTEMRMGYLDATGNFYTSAYTEDIASNWDIQLFFSYQTK